jgi:hypothetical protein
MQLAAFRDRSGVIWKGAKFFQKYHRRGMGTELLNQAFEEAAKLPEFEQNALATAILAAIRADKKWNEALLHSEDKLSRMADRALKADECDIELLDPDKL